MFLRPSLENSADFPAFARPPTVPYFSIVFLFFFTKCFLVSPSDHISARSTPSVPPFSSAINRIVRRKLMATLTMRRELPMFSGEEPLRWREYVALFFGNEGFRHGLSSLARLFPLKGEAAIIVVKPLTRNFRAEHNAALFARLFQHGMIPRLEKRMGRDFQMQRSI